MNLLIRSCVCSFHFNRPFVHLPLDAVAGCKLKMPRLISKDVGHPLETSTVASAIRRVDFLTAEVPTWEHEEEVSSSWRCMGRTAFWENCPLMVFSFLASWRCCVACSRGRPVKCQVLASSSSTSSSDLAWNSLNGTPIGLLDMKHSETISSTFVGDWS